MALPPARPSRSDVSRTARLTIMRPRVKVRLAIVPFTLALLAARSTGSSSGAGGSGALARAYSIRVARPGRGAATPTLLSPPTDAAAPGYALSHTPPHRPS